MSKAIELEPLSSLAYTSRALIRWANNQLEAAFKDVNYALTINPKNIQALHLKAQILVDANDEEKALEVLRQADLVDTGETARKLIASLQNGQLNQNMGCMLHLAGRRPRAIYQYKQTTRINAKYHCLCKSSYIGQ